MNNLKILARKALDEPAQNQSLATEFLDTKRRVRRYIVGKNAQAINIAKVISVDGIIDDYDKSLQPWKGIPIVSMAEVDNDAIVVNCSTSISPISVLRNLRKTGFTKILDFRDLASIAPRVIEWPWFVVDQWQDFECHSDEWENLYEALADNESRQTLLDVLRFRLTADYSYIRMYSVRMSDQYFEDFMSLQNEVFVDAGGFDGSTTKEFCRRYPNYAKVILIEPVEKNMRIAKARLAEMRNIEYFQIGLSNKRENLSFNAGAGSASAVDKCGQEVIRVDKLDAILMEPATFIKMDLEGWEMHALKGSCRHIGHERAKLAIAVYHKASDFRNIASYVNRIRPDSRMYLRHYTEGWSETVMYFL